MRWRDRVFRLRRRFVGAPPAEELYFRSMGPRDRRIVETALPYTITGVARLVALVEAVRHCVRAEIPGAMAECGVWRGGSIVAMILTLQECGVDDRDIYLYDTFGPMPYPGEHDRSSVYDSGITEWDTSGPENEPGLSRKSEEAVRKTVAATGYPDDRIHFVAGRVEDTVPERAPERLALLRLDTDFYESTRHELVHLYPMMSSGGILIIDDYGEWEGARLAVDEYFAEAAELVMLTPIDYSARLAVKR